MYIGIRQFYISCSDKKPTRKTSGSIAFAASIFHLVRGGFFFVFIGTYLQLVVMAHIDLKF